MQRLLLFLPRGRKAKDPRENAMEQTISVSLVTWLDSLDIMSDTKNKITWPQSPRFFRVRKFCHISKKKAAGISSFCCFAAMSAFDLGQEISVSDRYFLLLQATIKGSKVLRAQVAERTEKEEDVNRLTVKL